MRLGSRQDLEEFRRAVHRVLFACLFELSSLIHSLAKHAKAWLLHQKKKTFKSALQCLFLTPFKHAEARLLKIQK